MPILKANIDLASSSAMGILLYNVNILNVTIREVLKDNISSLPYARDDAFGLVCLFSQQQTFNDEDKMQHFTQAVIAEVLRLNGTFYLPYRLHYDKDQLLKAYPNILDWIKLKKKLDPTEIFGSQFFQYITSLIVSDNL